MEALLDHLARLLSVPSWCCVFSVRPEPEPLPKRREPLFQFRISLRKGDHDANPARLLRARRERPSDCSAVEQRDERASFHSHLVGLLSSRERIAHLGGAGVGVRCGGRDAAREFSDSPLTADMWTNAGFRRYGPESGSYRSGPTWRHAVLRHRREPDYYWSVT